MTQSHVNVSDYADELISTPRAHLRLELRQEDNSLVLSYEDRLLVECHITKEGMLAGGFMAESLGTKLPALGESVTVRVSTGVLFRAIGIAGLDFEKEESFFLLERLMDEAKSQRGASSDAS